MSIITNLSGVLGFQDENYTYPARIKLNAVDAANNVYDVIRMPGSGTEGTAIDTAFVDAIGEWVSTQTTESVNNARNEAAALMGDGVSDTSQAMDFLGAASLNELNGAYTGQNLATLLASEIPGDGNIYDVLHSRVSNANFAGLHIGDYIDVPLSDYSNVTTATSIRFLLAHIDPYYQCGDTAKGHHLAFVASAPVSVAGAYAVSSGYINWKDDCNNGTSSEEHPYLCSTLKSWEMLLEACLPSTLTAYLLTQRVTLPKRYSSGETLTDDSGCSWADIGKVWSLSEMEVYGCCARSNPYYNVGVDCQFDLFHGSKQRLNGSRVSWWLRSVDCISSSGACYVSNGGHANSNLVMSTYIRPRPGFLLG